MLRLPIPCRSSGLGRSFLAGVFVGIFLSYVVDDFATFFLFQSKDPHPQSRIERAKIGNESSENLSSHPVQLNGNVLSVTTSISIASNETLPTAILRSAVSNEKDILKSHTEKNLTNAHKNVTVLCWILTNPGNHMWKAIHVKNTWGKRCTKLLFMSTKKVESSILSEPKLPSIVLPNVKEGRDWLWAKTKEALKYIYAHHLDDADWILKADDDTYVIMENLKDLLANHNPKHPYLFGYEFITDWLSYKYMSGGAGYVMSKEALKRFVEKALHMNDTKCYTSYHDGMEDIEVSKCLLSVNTTFGNSRDSKGRERFNTGSAISDLGRYKNIESCSDSAITFHYTQPHELYFLEYMIYHLKPYNFKDSVSTESKAKINNKLKQKQNSTPKLKQQKKKAKDGLKPSTLSSKVSQIKTQTPSKSKKK